MENSEIETKSRSEGSEEPELITRKEFVKRFGIYAATIPMAVVTLFSPNSAKAIGSDGGP